MVAMVVEENMVVEQIMEVGEGAKDVALVVVVDREADEVEDEVGDGDDERWMIYG